MADHPPPRADWLHPAAALLTSATAYIEAELAGAASPPPPHLMHLIDFLKDSTTPTNGRRRSSVLLGDQVELLEREFTSATMAQPGPSIGRCTSSVSMVGDQVELLEREFRSPTAPDAVRLTPSARPGSGLTPGVSQVVRLMTGVGPPGPGKVRPESGDRLPYRYLLSPDRA